MTEPDVALTDYGLALLCGVLAWRLRRRSDPASALRAPFVLFFGALGATAFLGGTVHGFLADPSSRAHALLWHATMLGVGATALAAWIIGARMQFGPGPARWIEGAAALGFLVYAATVLLVSASFRVAVLNYLPAVLFLMIVYALRLRRRAERAILWGLGGFLVTLAAAAVQQAGIGLHPAYLDHNALYHLLQAAGLVLIFLSARHLVARGGGPEEAPEGA